MARRKNTDRTLARLIQTNSRDIILVCLLAIATFSFLTEERNVLQFDPAERSHVSLLVSTVQSRVGRDGLVFLSVANLAAKELLSNFLAHQRKLRIDYESASLMITDGSLVIDSDYKGLIVQILSKFGSGHLDYGTMDYQRMILYRTLIVNLLLQNGLSVLLVDIDSVWLDDPLQYILAHSSDIAGQLDGPKFLCCGFLYLNATSLNVRYLWNDVYKRFARELENQVVYGTSASSLTEQIILNHLIKDRWKTLNIRFLSQDKFPSGRDYFGRKSDCRPVIVHNNYIVGIAAKIHRFKQESLWLL